MNNPAVAHWTPLVARVLLSAVFLAAGFQKVTGFAGTVSYIASVGLPMPEVLAVLAIIIELGGGVMLLIGFMGRLAAKGLFFFTLLTTIFFHNNIADQIQVALAMKNLAIMGGLLMIFTHGTGPVSAGCCCPKCEKDDTCHFCEGAVCGSTSTHHA